MQASSKIQFLTTVSLLATATILLTQAARAQDKKQDKKEKDQNPAPISGSSAGPMDDIGGAAERVNVENIKQKYWARGDENELGVVQNRLYSKDKKIEFGLFGGVVASDPFLSVKNLGALLGFHFSEYLAMNIFGYKDLADPSSALALLEKPLSEGGLGTTANTNKPRWYLGGEFMFSPVYGKLSVLGKAIIHYDMHLLAGLGTTATESGRNLTPHVGIGQQIYLTQRISIRLDYRLQIYNDTIVEKVQPSRIGQVNGTRTNYSNTITLGVDFLIDPFGKKQEAVQQ